MTKINPRRLAVLISLIAFSVMSVLTGSWKAVLEYPSAVKEFQYQIVAEEYAAKIGTTVEGMKRNHRETAIKRFSKEWEKSNSTNNDTARRSALQFAAERPLIGFPKNSLSEIFEASRRALPSLTVVFSDLLKAIGIALFICFAAPALVKRTWDWLQNKSRNAN